MIIENTASVEKRKKGERTRLLMSIWETSGEQIGFLGRGKIFTTSMAGCLARLSLILLFHCELFVFQ